MAEIDERLSKRIKNGRSNREKNDLSSIVARYLRDNEHVTAEYLDGQSTGQALGEFIGWCRANGVDYPVDKGSKTVFTNTVRDITGSGYKNSYFRLDAPE